MKNPFKSKEEPIIQPSEHEIKMACLLNSIQKQIDLNTEQITKNQEQILRIAETLEICSELVHRRTCQFSRKPPPRSHEPPDD